MALEDSKDASKSDSPLLILRVSSRYGGSTAEPYEFWSSLRAKNGESLQSQWERHQAALLDRFPRELTRRARQAARKFGSSRTLQGFPTFRFRIQGEIAYGSLIASLAIDNLPSLIAAFGGASSEVIVEILRTCCEEAFEDITGAMNATCELTPNSSFLAPVAKAASQQPGSAWTKAFVLAQRSFWLIPLVLALAVMGVALSGLIEQMGRLHQQEERFEKRQDAYVASYDARVQRLEELNSQLIAQLRKEPEKPETTSCPCPVCCSLPPCPSPAKPPPPRKVERACKP